MQERLETRADDGPLTGRYRCTYRSHFTGRFLKSAFYARSSNDRLYSSSSYHSIFHGEKKGGRASEEFPRDRSSVHEIGPGLSRSPVMREIEQVDFRRALRYRCTKIRGNAALRKLLLLGLILNIFGHRVTFGETIAHIN